MSTNLEQYIQFGMGHEKYAVHISDIHEIIKIQEISEIPNVMPYVKGVINLRGKVVPVISLRRMFKLTEDQYTKHTRIVVVNHQEEKIGIVVDHVDKVTTFSDIQPPPEQVGGMQGCNFSGMGVVDELIVGILKLERVLVKEGHDIGQH